MGRTASPNRRTRIAAIGTVLVSTAVAAAPALASGHGPATPGPPITVVIQCVFDPLTQQWKNPGNGTTCNGPTAVTIVGYETLPPVGIFTTPPTRAPTTTTQAPTTTIQAPTTTIQAPTTTTQTTPTTRPPTAPAATNPPANNNTPAPASPQGPALAAEQASVEISSASVDCNGAVTVNYDSVADADAEATADYIVMVNPLSTPNAFTARRSPSQPTSGSFTQTIGGAIAEPYQVFVIADFKPADPASGVLVAETEALVDPSCPAAP